MDSHVSSLQRVEHLSLDCDHGWLKRRADVIEERLIRGLLQLETAGRAACSGSIASLDSSSDVFDVCMFVFTLVAGVYHVMTGQQPFPRGRAAIGPACSHGIETQLPD